MRTAESDWAKDESTLARNANASTRSFMWILQTFEEPTRLPGTQVAQMLISCMSFNRPPANHSSPQRSNRMASAGDDGLIEVVPDWFPPCGCRQPAEFLCSLIQFLFVTHGR